jgi:hypothetical protein
MTERKPSLAEEPGSAAGTLARLWWMLIGNFLMVICLVFILHNRKSFFHPADPVFAFAVVSLVLARFIDIRFCHGLTATGVPASMRTWKRYAAMLVSGAAVAWAAAHGISHWLSSPA